MLKKCNEVPVFCVEGVKVCTLWAFPWPPPLQFPVLFSWHQNSLFPYLPFILSIYKKEKSKGEWGHYCAKTFLHPGEFFKKNPLGEAFHRACRRWFQCACSKNGANWKNRGIFLHGESPFSLDHGPSLVSDWWQLYWVLGYSLSYYLSPEDPLTGGDGDLGGERSRRKEIRRNETWIVQPCQLWIPSCALGVRCRTGRAPGTTRPLSQF